MAIIHVNQNVSQPGGGTSWQTALSNLSSALDQAQSGDEIWVARGTYTPGLTRNDSFVIDRGIAVYGGFVGDEVNRRDRSWTENPTILSGNLGEIGKSHHVVVNQSTELARLDGLIIQDGDTTEASDNQDGGGIYNQKNKKLILENTIVQNNVASDDGGGIRNDGELTIINTTVANNRANGTEPTAGGGGLLNTVGATTTVLNTTFSNNSAQKGGAIRNDAALTLINVTISGNEGGGLLNTTTNPLASGAASGRATIASSTITQNKGTGTDNFGILLLSNNIIAGNNNGDNDLSNFAFGAVDSSGNNIIGDRGNVKDGFLQSDLIGSATEQIEPLLGGLQDNGGFTQTHQPTRESPAIDSGAPSLESDAFDIDGDQDTAEGVPFDQRGKGFDRVVGTAIDIGAVELNAEKVEFVEPVEPIEAIAPTIPAESIEPPEYLKLSLQASNTESSDNILVLPIDSQGSVSGFELENADFFRDVFAQAQNTLSALQFGTFEELTLSRTLDIPTDASAQLTTLLRGAAASLEPIDLSPLDFLGVDVFEQLENENLKFGFRLTGAEAYLDDVVLLAELTQAGIPFGARLQGSDQPELIDLRNTTDTVAATFEVYREAAFNNEVGFFEIEDITGQVLDAQGNLIGINDDGYVLAAMQQRIDVNLTAQNNQMNTYTTEISGGKLLSSFVVSSGSVADLLDSDAGNDPTVYFAHVGANSDRTDHIKLLGDNTFGFEDMEGGGDQDFNDIIVKANFA